jgi:hypothetical protein
MTRRPLRINSLEVLIGAGALVAVLAVPVPRASTSDDPTHHAMAHDTTAHRTTVLAGGAVLADSDDDDDSGSGNSHTLRNNRCDPGYPRGVCVQSPTQSENNTTSEG